MATQAHPNTAHTPASHPAQHRSYAVGGIEMSKMVKLFHESAWWFVNSQNTHSVDSSALADDLASNFVHMFWRPTVRTVESVPYPKFDHNVHVVASDDMSAFLTRLHDGGFDAARAYAQQVQSRQTNAQNAVLAKIADARAHNAKLIEQCTRDMTYLSNTIFVCEVAIAVGVCVLSMGTAMPAFLPLGATGGVAQGLTAFGISEGYSLAAHMVSPTEEHSPNKWKDVQAWFVKPETEFGHKTAAAGFVTMAGVAAESHNIEAHRQLIRVARAKTASINAALAERIGLLRRAHLNLQKIGPAMAKVDAMQAIKASRVSKFQIDHIGKGFSLVQCAADILSALSGLKERNEIIEH